MTLSYENTGIWKRAFANQTDREVTTLVSEYAKAWEKAGLIAKQIASDAPGLTLHEEHHFSALWRAADLLVPADVTLSPIEIFIFGTSILVHDAAHTVLAYEGGIEALKKTDEWRDNLAVLFRDEGDKQPLTEGAEVPDSIHKRVLFNTLRGLHAKQAPHLLSLPFKHSAIGLDFFIINDATLRFHLAGIIGTVAASHHWDLAKVGALNKTINVISPYDKWGPVRQLYLAALMRTADAIQIDAARAPDFELILSNPGGLSADHWTAQNRLAIGVDPKDDEALTINSSVPFKEDRAGAWWIAYDLARLADKELRQTDALLRDYNELRLCLRRVKDVETPERFSDHVKADGWQPITAEVTVGDTATLIDLLGGIGLYGDNSVVPLRELLQNSVDAVRARRLLQDDYSGKINVELTRSDETGGPQGYWLRVSDDGFGMSSAILTGPFLTFGQSGWTSTTLKGEYPGFLGRQFKRIGRYGIGFFSVFMISDFVRVTSRGFQQGLSESKTVQFSSGLGLRPLFKNATDAAMSKVTSIELFLSERKKAELLYRAGNRTIFENGELVEKSAESFSLADLIGMICPSIDVDIETFDSDSNVRRTIKGDWQTTNVSEWLARINGVDPAEIPPVITRNSELVEVIGSPGRYLGRASLNPSSESLGINSVGGFGMKQTDRVSHRGSTIVGSLDWLPSGPKRDVGTPIDEIAISEWATTQVQKWSKVDLSGQEQNYVAANAAHYQGDSSLIANAQIDGGWFTVGEIYVLLEEGKSIFAPIRSRSRDNWTIAQSVNLPSGYLYHRDDVKTELSNVLAAGATAEMDTYWKVLTTTEEAAFSLLSILAKFCVAKGRELSIDAKMIDFGSYQGQTIERDRRTKGERIVVPGIELTLSASENR